VPSKKATVPGAAAGAIVAVRVTEDPWTTGPAGVPASDVIVVAAVTVSDDAGVDVDVPKFAGLVGTNCAVRECVPTPSVLVLTETPVPFQAWLAPTWVVPSKNLIEPTALVGVTAPERVTVVPKPTGPVGETVRLVLVVVAGAALTVYDVAGVEVEPRKAVGSVGVNVAVNEWVPTASALVVLVAVPPDTDTGEPIAFVPSRNCTVPAALGAMVAVSVRVSPTVLGLAGETASVVVVGVAGGSGFTV
jgi:hypothetical protein